MLTIMIVSLRVSPFDWLLVLASEKPMTRPPRRLTAVSKLRRVRVDGSKNSVAVKNVLIWVLLKSFGLFEQIEDFLFVEVGDGN